MTGNPTAEIELAGKKTGAKTGKKDGKKVGKKVGKKKDKKQATQMPGTAIRSPTAREVARRVTPPWTAGALAAGAAVVVLSGCVSAQPIFNRGEFESSRFVATDARQRVVLNSDVGRNSVTGLVDPLAINCTEPSPDVATTVATSMGAALGRAQTSASFTFQQAQALAQLVERTASIQLLRDKMYQTCLSYSNGAITGTTYTVVMSQLDKAIVTLMLGETAGGAFGRSLAAISGNTEGETSASAIGLPSAIEDLNALAEELETAQAAVDAAEEKLDDKKQASEDAPDDNDKKQAVTTAQGEYDQAVGRRNEILNRLQSRTEALAESSAEATATAGGALSSRTSPLIARTLADMQEGFLLDGLGESVIAACLSELGIAPALDIKRGAQPPDEYKLLYDAQAAVQRAEGQLRAAEATAALATDSEPAQREVATADAAYRAARENRDRLVSEFAASTAVLSQVMGRNVTTQLTTFCSEHFSMILADAAEKRHALQEKRLNRRADEAREGAEVARAEAARARAEEAKYVNEAFQACSKLPAGKVQETCFQKLPEVPKPDA
jgi:hypothetical protein